MVWTYPENGRRKKARLGNERKKNQEVEQRLLSRERYRNKDMNGKKLIKNNFGKIETFDERFGIDLRNGGHERIMMIILI